jgi:hypothetical protein
MVESETMHYACMGCYHLSCCAQTTEALIRHGAHQVLVRIAASASTACRLQAARALAGDVATVAGGDMGGGDLLIAYASQTGTAEIRARNGWRTSWEVVVPAGRAAKAQPRRAPRTRG